MGPNILSCFSICVICATSINFPEQPDSAATVSEVRELHYLIEIATSMTVMTRNAASFVMALATIHFIVTTSLQSAWQQTDKRQGKPMLMMPVVSVR